MTPEQLADELLTYDSWDASPGRPFVSVRVVIDGVEVVHFGAYDATDPKKDASVRARHKDDLVALLCAGKACNDPHERAKGMVKLEPHPVLQGLLSFRVTVEARDISWGGIGAPESPDTGHFVRESTENVVREVEAILRAGARISV